MPHDFVIVAFAPEEALGSAKKHSSANSGRIGASNAAAVDEPAAVESRGLTESFPGESLHSRRHFDAQLPAYIYIYVHARRACCTLFILSSNV